MALFTAPAGLGIALTGYLYEEQAREPWIALVAVPSLLWLPGLPLARALAVARGQPTDWRRICFDAFWVGIAQSVLIFLAGRTFYGVGAALGMAAALCVTGAVAGGIFGWWRQPKPWAEIAVPSPASFGGNTYLGIAFILLCVGGWFYDARVDIARPLDRYWWSPHLEELPATTERLEPPAGFIETTFIDDEGQAYRALPNPDGSTPPTVSRRQDQPLLVLVHGFTGFPLTFAGRPFSVEPSPVEDESEGPVRRYGSRGVVALWVPPETVPTKLSFGSEYGWSPPGYHGQIMYAIGSQDGAWAIDGSGELHFTHYYQLLNMVEQFDWADDRLITDVQPPLWTWVLGSVIAVTHGDMPTANVLLTYILVVIGLGGLLFMRRFANDAPWPAWLLPGAGAVVVGKLVLEPGSSSMPDALYTAAIVAAVATVQDGWRATSALGLAAQLLRYPGSAVVFVAMLLAGVPRVAFRFVVVVVVTAALFGAGGYATGTLDGWLDTVAWESGPEHWHGEYAPSTLAARIPAFYWTWLYYAGGAPVLALLAFPRGTKIALGTALIYSLLLCTIDHSPTHYFLPLVMLSVLAVASSASHTKWRPLAWAAPLLTLAGLGIFWFRGEIVG